MSFTSSFLAAVIPMSLYLIIIWRLDRYEREPLSKVIKHFIWGAVGAVILAVAFSSALIYSTNLFISSPAANTFIATVIIAPFAEEIVKALFLFYSSRKNYFDNLTDGLVYGGAIGLGFGMTENLLYFNEYNDSVSQWITVVIMRTIFSAVMHAIATSTVGAFLAKAKFSLNSKKYIYPLIGLSFAMFFHAAWNFSLTFEFTFYIGMLFMIFLISSFFYVYSSSLNNEKRIISSELKNEAVLIGLSENDNIDLNEIKMMSKNFIVNKQRKQFSNFATKLAFRKLQSKNSIGVQQESYNKDIFKLREEIKNLRNLNKV